MEKDDEKIIDSVVNTEETVEEPAENPVIAPAEDVIPATNGEGEIVDDNTEIEPEEPTVEPVVPPTEDETLAPTDDIIPAPEEVPVEIPAEPEPVAEPVLDAPMPDIAPPMQDIPVDAPVEEPVIDEPVVSDVRPDAGDETPVDVPVDAPVEAPCEECPNCVGDENPTDIAVPGECPGCEGECPTPDVIGDGLSVGQIFGTFQESVTIIWQYHLKTRKHHVHVTLNEFYEKALDVVDNIIEMYQGIHGIVEEPFTNHICADGTSEVEYLNNLKVFVENNKFVLGTESEIASAIDDLLGLIDTTLYKLTSFTENVVKSFEEFCYEDLNEYRVYNKYGDLISDDEEDEDEDEENPQDDNGNPGKPGPGGDSVDEEEDEGEEEE